MTTSSDLRPLAAAELDELERRAKETPPKEWYIAPATVLRLIEQLREAEKLVVQLRDVLGWGLPADPRGVDEFAALEAAGLEAQVSAIRARVERDG